VFSLWVDKDSQKLGLMRLLLKHYIDEIRRVLTSVSMVKPAVPEDLKELLLTRGSDSGLMLARRAK
jgi:hypothetical protein